MMNVLRTVSYISRRTYSRRTKNVGIRGKLQMSKRSGLKFDIDEINHDDLDEFELEYMNADKFYDIHEREKESSKEQLKNKIVATKYFKKNKDPNFLTTIEKQEIRKLYKSNPEEWTIEKLSESFPALPVTIKKILKSNWSLTSVEQVLRNDATVINNWKQFQAGKLPLSPDLQEHLIKFKNREIVLPNRDLLAKALIPPKPELPKPRSIFFSKIVQSYLDQNKNNQSNNVSLQDGKKTIVETNISSNIIKDRNISKNIFDKENPMEKEILDKNNKLVITENKNSLQTNVCEAKLTWNEFAKKEIPKIYADCPEAGITLLNVYKQYIQSQNSLPSNIKENTAELKHTESAKKEMTSVSVKDNDSSQLVSTEKLNVNLSTYVKVRNSKIEYETYSLPIKIPKNIHKKGKTYRICDCYYDDDGQFLYRVPGLRN